MMDLFVDYKKGDKDFVVLEGLHAIKHAYRFGAKIERVTSCDKRAAIDLSSNLAPDILDFLQANIIEISEEDFTSVFPKNFHGQIVAIAKKKENHNLDGLCVWLESPSSLNNAGAVIRVLAARGVRNLVISGSEFDIWHKDVIRAGAGLHFALENILEFKNSKLTVEFLKSRGYKLIALDPQGQVLQNNLELSENNCLIFGTERNGLSEFVKEKADSAYRIPMQERVSSLNLATSVAASLYGWVR